MSKKIRFGIIGYGRIGTRHATKIEENQNAELIAVCDNKKARRDEIANVHTADVYDDYKELLAREDIDVVCICTPNAYHSEMTCAAAHAGKHIVCEKPMCLTVEEGKKMCASAEENNVHLFIVKQNRYNPPVAKIKEVLDEGRLGKVLMVVVNVYWNRNVEYYSESDWKGTRALDGGTLYTQVSHFIDLMLWFTGQWETCSFNGRCYTHDIEFEDSGVVSLTFENGAIGTLNYTVCSEDHNMEGSITVFGEKGTVKIGGQYLNVLEYEQIRDYTIPELEPSRPANDYGKYQGSMSNHDKVIANVIDVLCNQAEPHVTAHEALKTVALIEECYRQRDDR